MKIIVINGLAQSGKDTFVKACRNWANEREINEPKKNINVYNISSVDFVKDIAKKAGWDGVKDERGRKLLSDLKDCLTEYDDIPFKQMLKLINFYLSGAEGFKKSTKNMVFFLHSREPEEISRWAKDYNALTLFIQRPGYKTNYSNHADRLVDCYNYDYTYWNVNSLEGLEKDAISFIERILAEDWYSDNEDLNIWDKDSYGPNRKVREIKEIKDNLWVKLP